MNLMEAVDNSNRKTKHQTHHYKKYYLTYLNSDLYTTEQVVIKTTGQVLIMF